jgi:hypothetical protein
MRLTALWPTGQRGGAGAARYVQNASRDERWGPVVPRGPAFLSGKHCLVRDQHSVRGRGRSGPGASEPSRTPFDHSDRGADTSGAGTRTLPKAKHLTALCKRAAPRRDARQ